MKRLQILIVLWLSAITALGQTTRMEGVVLSADDDSPIIGATVTIDGTKKIAATDFDGKFTFDNLTANDKTFTVTYVGMKPQTLPIAPKVTVKLVASDQMMDEVLVVAFGKQKRESFTGSASAINSESIEKRSVNNPISALSGAVAGVQMTGGNDLTDEPTIRVRGISSINASKDPLIVLDGLPYSGYWSDLNPADIESITVLKDAASNALYGARGANGVILITTKSAQRGNTQVTLDVRLGVNTDGKVQYDIIDNPGEYYEAHYAMMRNYFLSTGMSAYDAHIRANANLYDHYENGGLGYMVYSVPDGQLVIGDNGKLNPNARLGNRIYYGGQFYTIIPDDWKKEGLRNGFRQEYNLALNGGNDKYSFYASLGCLDNEGLSYGSNLKRYSARLKTDYQAYSWLKVGGNAGYTHSENSNLTGAFAAAYNAGPIYPVYIRDGEGNIMTDSHGKRYDYGNGDNAGLIRPYEPNSNDLQFDRIDEASNNSNSFNIQGYATADFLNGFRFTANANVYITENRINTAYNPYYGYSVATGGSIYTYHYRTLNSNFQQLLNYDRTFGQHNVSVLLGHEYTYNNQTQLYGAKNKIAMFESNKELNGAIINVGTAGYQSKYNVEGFFARAQYDFDSRLFASASFRRDGSSVFHPDHRWGNFWSVGGAWIISRESWFPKSPAVQMLKLKASYGEQGNDGIGSFRYVDFYNITSSNDNVAYTFSSKGNPDITWETVGCFNAGVEFELFNNRLSGSAEFYTRKTSDMLMTFQVPLSMGYSYYYDNIGDMKNTGVEVDLRGRIIDTKELTWNIGANWTFQRNKVSFIPDANKEATLNGYNGFISGNQFVGEGLPMYTWRLKKYAGPNENGQSTWYVTNADGTTSTTTSFEGATYYECGTALPDMFGGFNTEVRFKGFDLSASFAYSIGGKKIDSGYKGLMVVPYGYHVGLNIHRDAVYKAWSKDNPDSDVPRWQYGDEQASFQSDRWLTDGSWLAFQNITFGYSLPKSITTKLHMSKLRVYFVCDNVAYWSKRKGFDPRLGTTSSGGDSYSPIRSFSGGLNIAF